MEENDATMMESTTNAPFVATIDAPIQLYNDSNDENSIENLLEELSAQQNVSWEEMEAQCITILGLCKEIKTFTGKTLLEKSETGGIRGIGLDLKIKCL